MEVEGEVQKTTVKNNELWPVWRERFAFPIHESRVRLATINIEVCAVRQPRACGPDPLNVEPWEMLRSVRGAK